MVNAYQKNTINKSISEIVFIFSILLININPNLALGDGAPGEPIDAIKTLKERCSHDSLDKNQAIERNEWALKCGYIDSKRYTLNVNRERPKYPTFLFGDLSGSYTAEVDRNKPCNPEIRSELLMEDYIITLFCTSLCFVPEQLISFEDGDFPIIDAIINKVTNVLVVSNNSTLENIILKSLPINNYVSDILPAWQKIITLKTSLGSVLKVTTNHPLVMADGHLKEASNIKAGELLLRSDGISDLIISAIETDYFGKVYNLSPKSEHSLEQIIVADGVLSGSSWYQDEGTSFLNRSIFRYKTLVKFLD